MDLVKLLNDLVANIAALQAQLVDAQASADALAVLKFEEGKQSRQAEVDALLAKIAELEAGNIPSDKIYTQTELEVKIAEALAPLNEKVAALEAKVLELETLKAQMLADFESAQVDDQAFLAKYKG